MNISLIYVYVLIWHSEENDSGNCLSIIICMPTLAVLFNLTKISNWLGWQFAWLSSKAFKVFSSLKFQEEYVTVKITPMNNH